MTRLPNWQSALGEYITRHAETPFKYGQLDCGLFALGAIEVLTGVDVAPELRGAYSNREEAFAALRRLYGAATVEGVAQLVAARHQLPEVPVLMAQRGDPVVVRKGRSSSLGIVDMNPGFILRPHPKGLVRLPLSIAQRAYRIG